MCKKFFAGVTESGRHGGRSVFSLVSHCAKKFCCRAMIQLTRKTFLDTIRHKGEKFFSEVLNVLQVIDDKNFKRK